MIKAIIFDCFGVLTTEGWIAFKHEHFGKDPEKMERASELSRQVDSGLVSYEESLQEIANMAKTTPEQLNKILKDVVTNRPLLDYIRGELKPVYKIGLLSNVGDNWLYSMFEESEIALFDAIALSHESGITKPDPRAYEAIAMKLGVEPEECVFVDDLERNVTGAKEIGMQAILYKDFDQLKAELGRLLAV